MSTLAILSLTVLSQSIIYYSMHEERQKIAKRY